MGERILLDTDVLIDYYKEKIDLPPGNIYYISTITLYEYIRGTKKPEEAKKLLEESFIVAALDNQVLLKSAEIWRDLRQKGILIDDRDLIIGVTAITSNLKLYTKNAKHFKRLAEYGLEFYKP
ncbi:MAG: type II toxin-antitoxin system VapC family toxin [Thermoprotei archaeon]|nr:MAG: type II toxin-antitoxin system VapC family toxin [Thermoprotei archaeon]RLE95529.1 MAG: type II toxin-antitoxin system VapC family toxin [Thermoprotei archaeon]